MSASTRRVTWRTDRWVRPFFRQYRRVFLIAISLGAMAALCAAGLMFTSGYLISAAASGVDSIIALHVPIAFVQLFGVGKPFVQYLERLRAHDWVLRMTSGLRLALYRSLERVTLRPHRAVRTGEVMGLVADDIGHLQNLYVRTILPLVVAYLVWFVVLVVAGLFSPFLLFALLLTIGVAVFVVPWWSVVISAARRARAKELRAQLYDKVADNVMGVQDWACAQRQHECELLIADAADAAAALDAAEARSARRRQLLSELSLGCAVVALLVWSGFTYGGSTAAGAGAQASANWIAACALVFFPLIETFSGLAQASVDALDHRASIERLNALPAVPDTISPDSEAQQQVTTACRDNSSQTVSHDAIELCDVVFSYPGQSSPVLDHLSLRIAAGQHVAVLGRSGAGKSTMLSVIRGDYPVSRGGVCVNGVDICAAHQDISHLVGVIQQNPYVFNWSLADNVRVGKPDASDDDVRAALSAVGLDALVDRLREGIDTRIDESGASLSGGEWHRVALARVLLADTPLVLLDEPFVALDPVTELQLIDTILSVFAFRTVVLVTHHLFAVEKFDRVVFLGHGKVILDGAPHELERSSAKYRQLLSLEQGV